MDFQGKDIICGSQYNSLEDVMTGVMIEIGAHWALICSFEKKSQPFGGFVKNCVLTEQEDGFPGER